MTTLEIILLTANGLLLPVIVALAAAVWHQKKLLINQLGRRPYEPGKETT